MKVNVFNAITATAVHKCLSWRTEQPLYGEQYTNASHGEQDIKTTAWKTDIKTTAWKTDIKTTAWGTRYKRFNVLLTMHDVDIQFSIRMVRKEMM